MISPQRFRGILHFEYKTKQNSTGLIDNLFQQFHSASVSNVEKRNKSIRFESTKSLFNINYFVDIKIVEGQDNKIEYFFSFGELYKFVLIILLFALFFSRFSWWIYIVISGVLSFSLITINISIVNSFIKNNILAAILNQVYIGDNYISKAQKEWMGNPLLCSGCGSELTEYNKVCHECGLKVEGKKIKSPINTSLGKLDIKYDLKKKNEKDSS